MMNNYFKQLLEKAKNTSNSEEAKAIKRKLMLFGGIGVAVGIVMVLFGFISFGIGAFNSVNHSSVPGSSEFNPIIYIVIFMLGGFIASISGYVLYAGLSIHIAGITTNYLDVRDKCPNCGDEIDEDEDVCSNCGYQFKKEKICSNCGYENKSDDNYCRKCGKQL